MNKTILKQLLQNICILTPTACPSPSSRILLGQRGDDYLSATQTRCSALSATRESGCCEAERHFTAKALARHTSRGWPGDLGAATGGTGLHRLLRGHAGRSGMTNPSGSRGHRGFTAQTSHPAALQGEVNTDKSEPGLQFLHVHCNLIQHHRLTCTLTFLFSLVLWQHPEQRVCSCSPVSENSLKPGQKAQQHPQQPAQTLLRAAPAGKANIGAANKQLKIKRRLAVHEKEHLTQLLVTSQLRARHVPLEGTPRAPL